MGSDDLAVLKDVRKAKKKEIQAWITAFEEREGRSPKATDKAAIRPMYREFRELEAKIKSILEENSGGNIDATDMTKGEEPTEGPLSDTAAVGTARVGAGAGDDGIDLATIKNERDAKKRDIKEWINAFEEREGRTPTTKDKAPIKDLYVEFKDLERRLADHVRGGGEDDTATIAKDIPSNIEGIKAEKKRVKREIQTWIEAFESREGRPALQEDKSEIRPLYKRHKDLERELTRLTAVASSSASDPATSADPSASVPPPDTATDDIDPSAMILSPSSSMGYVVASTPLEGEDINKDDYPEQGVDEQHASAPPPDTATDDIDPSAMVLNPSSSIGDIVASRPLEGKYVNTDDDREQGADGQDDLSHERGRSIDTMKRVADGGGATPGLLSPLPSLSPDRSVVQDHFVGDTAIDGKNNVASIEAGDGGGGEAGVQEEKGSSQESAALGEVESTLEDQSQSGKVDDNGGGTLERIQTDKDLALDVHSEEKGASEDAAQTAPNTGIRDDDTSLPFSTSSPFISPEDNNSNSNAKLMFGGNEEEKSDDGDGSKPKSMTAQEARVRRMRARFLDMKNLIEDEPALPSSPTPAAGNSPRKELSYGLADAKEDEDIGASAIPIKGAMNRWALLGDAVAPNRLSQSPRSPRSPSQRALERVSGNEKKAGTISLSRKTPHGAAPGDVSEQATADSVSAPLADDGVSGAWISGQMSNMLLSDAPLPPPPTPPGLVDLEAKASRLSTAVDPPTPGYVAEYQSGVRGSELVLASVGVEEVRARERALELERLAAAREETNVYRAREANLLYREDRARRRVLAYKNEIERTLTVEKKTIIEMSVAGERVIAPAFARARRGLERAIQAQAGRVREVFGELRPGETPGGRRFRVDWKGMPQPVEIRLHCIRAVRDRLPRGSYVMLASMAERLGGRVMRWRKGDDFDDFNEEDSIDTDGGDTRPTATLPVKHGGRYFDRELRLDQNVHQLCPSKSDVRPGNVLVFELFRLAGSGGGSGSGGARCGSSRHKGGELDEDTAVGWCVLPLADSHLRIVRGSFRIPLLRGEPNPNIDLHEGLEKLIAADLEAWLGNLYLDIRHLPREARLEDAGPEGGSAIGGEGFDIEYDHVRKSTRLGKGLMGKLATTAGRWQRWKARRENPADDDGGDDDNDDDDDDDNSVVDDDASLRKSDRDIEAGLGSGVELQVDNDAGTADSLLLLKEEPDEDAGEATVAPADGDDTAPKPSSDEEKGVANSARQQEEKVSEEVGGANASESSKKKKKPAWFGVKKKQKGWIDDVLPPPDSPRKKKAKEKKQSKKKGDGGIDAPPPQGGWASHLEGEEDANTGDNNVDLVKVEETVDEECLSDDDMPRGKTFRFTPVGEAALAVDTASGAGAHASRNAKRVGLRRRGEGARWDSAALGLGHRGLPKRYSRASTGAKDSHVWTPLTNPAEMEFYRFAVASDPGTDTPPTPAHIIAHKLRYIQQEVLLDLHPRGWRVVEYWLAVMVFLGALWLRVYIHALGQWFLLYGLGVPVFSFSPRLWEFAIKYMDRSSSLGVEIAFVWWGPTFVMLCFAGVAALVRLWGLAACGGKGGGGGEGVPETFSRFVAAFGVAAGLDPYLLFIVDFMAGNHDCASKCPDYTSPTCRCHEGDAWKLYVRLDAEEGAGISGALLTVLIYAMVSIVTALILHQYLLHAHMNGRMLDVWRRLNADEDNFFVPHDLELSTAELQHACVRATRWRGPNGSRREVVFYDFHANDEEEKVQSAGASPPRLRGGGGNKKNSTSLRGGIAGGGGGGAFHRAVGGRGGRGGRGKGGGHSARTTHVVIYEVSLDAKKSLHRQFLRTSDGTILEVFGEAGQEVGWQLTSSLNALIREEMGGKASDEVEKDPGIFAGMLPMAAPVGPAASTLDKRDEENTIDA